MTAYRRHECEHICNSINNTTSWNKVIILEFNFTQTTRHTGCACVCVCVCVIHCLSRELTWHEWRVANENKRRKFTSHWFRLMSIEVNCCISFHLVVVWFYANQHFIIAETHIWLEFGTRGTPHTSHARARHGFHSIDIDETEVPGRYISKTRKRTHQLAI